MIEQTRKGLCGCGHYKNTHRNAYGDTEHWWQTPYDIWMECTMGKMKDMRDSDPLGVNPNEQFKFMKCPCMKYKRIENV